MEAVFLKLLNMSITASWLVFAVVVLRFVFKKSPRVLFCILWALVGLRLVCPFSLESILSLIPSAEPVESMLNLTTSAEAVSTDVGYYPASTIIQHFPPVNSTVYSEPYTSVADSMTVAEIITLVASIVWAVGVAVMVLYAIISFMRLRKKVGESVLLKDNIYICDRIPSPFILGLFRPKIYLPSSMNEEDMEYVIAHEKAHIKRGDHIHKPLGFALLSVYWFNPVLWVAYILLCRDIEFACDEKVIKNMGAEIKKPYSTALINCSVNRKMISACPLAFGEVGVKGRIKSVLNYKKPAFWIICVALIASIVVSVCFLTNPLKEKSQDVTPLKNGSDIEGVSIEIIDSDLSAIDPYIEIEWKNDTDKDITYGEEFYIKRNSKDCREGAYFWNDIAYMLKAGESTTKKYTLNDITMTEPGKYRFETSCSVDGAKPYKEYKVWVEFELNDSSKFIYPYVLNPVELVYADGSYSYIQQAENAPQYEIRNNMLLCELPKYKSEATDLGQMTEITLDEEKFDSRFNMGNSESSEKLLPLKKENKKAWELYTDDEGLYLLMEQEDGSLYIGIGSYNCDLETKPNEDNSYIRWFYRLEKRPVTTVYATPDTTSVVIDPSMLDYSIDNNEVTINRCSTYVSGDVAIPDTIEGCPVTRLSYRSFADCIDIESIYIPYSVTFIDARSFENCEKLEKITLFNNNVDIQYDVFKNTAYYNDTDNWEDGVLYLERYLIEANEDIPEHYAIKNGTTAIANSAFSDLKHIKSIVIPDGEFTIPDNAFSGCDNLEKIDFLGSKINISSYAIADTELYNNPDNWEDGVLYLGNYLIKANEYISGNYKVKNGTTTISQSAFYQCDKIKSITLPDSVEYVDSLGFNSCDSLESINIPKKTKITEYTFANCPNLTDIVVDSGNKYYCVEEGVLYSKDKKTLMRYPTGNKREAFDVPDRVETIGALAFNDSKYLKKVVLPDSVKELGAAVFYDCEYLSEIVLPDNLKTIPASTFEGCKSLKIFTVPKNVTYIEDKTFMGCVNLERVTLPQGLKGIGWDSFRSCYILKNITIPDGVTTIELGAFINCDSLEEITIPDSVENIETDAFEWCDNLKTVKFNSDAQKEKFKDLFGKKVNLVVE